MRYRALATDYDGTLASEGSVPASTVSALERLRESGRRLILVTGRDLHDLMTVFPRLDVFDRVVAENGALLYRPQTREEVPLAERASPALASRLQASGAEPLSVGHSIIATREPFDVLALAAIRELGLELQLIFNKGAVMILPSGVNKRTGLAAALDELELSRHNVVAVGDAENDHAMLAACECGVAVANALDALKDRADLVTRTAASAGVEEVVRRLLDDDLRSLLVPRHTVALGAHPNGTLALMPAQGRRVLIAGPPRSGKTTCAAGLLERLIDAGYQCCLLDPEDEYGAVAGMLDIGSAALAPRVDELVEVLRKPDASARVKLGAVPVKERAGFLSALLPKLRELHTRTGRPHWIFVDDAAQFLPTDWTPLLPFFARHLGGVVLIAADPGRISSHALDSIDTALAVGEHPERTLAPVVAMEPSRPLAADEVFAWNGGLLERLHVLPPRSAQREQHRVYTDGDVREKAFVFRGPEGKLSLRAQNLAAFLMMAEGVDDATWLHHLQQRDYSRWFRRDLKDDALAREAEVIEGDDDAQSSRARIRAAIERRYPVSD